MDMVTLYAIHALANGTPKTWQRQVPAHVCETIARKTRVAYPQTVVWYRSELEPRSIVPASKPSKAAKVLNRLSPPNQDPRRLGEVP